MFKKKKFKMADEKKKIFQNRQFSKFFCKNFTDWSFQYGPAIKLPSHVSQSNMAI